MSNEEVIKLLKGYCEWCTAQGGDCQANLDGCNIFDIIDLLQQPEPEVREFTKKWQEKRRELANLKPDDEMDFLEQVIHGMQDLQKKGDEACDIIDREAQEKAEAVAARVEAENKCCVLRGEIEKLKEVNLRFRKMEREIVHCPKCDKSYFTHELFDCPFCEDQALKVQAKALEGTDATKEENQA